MPRARDRSDFDYPQLAKRAGIVLAAVLVLRTVGIFDRMLIASVSAGMTGPARLLMPFSRGRGSDGDGMTALHRAVERGDEDFAQRLIDHHADLNARSRRGRTPLMVAADAGHLGLVQILLDAHARSDSTDQLGRTALILAVMKARQESVNKLLGANADFRIEDKSGMSALCYAVRDGYIDMVRVLLAKGADPHSTCGGQPIATLSNEQAMKDSLDPPVRAPRGGQVARDPMPIPIYYPPGTYRER